VWWVYVLPMNAATKTVTHYQVVLPSGRIVTFNSKAVRTHAVVRTGHVRAEWNDEGMVSSHGTLKAAQKAAQTAAGANRGNLGVRVVECTPV
jgi:hypothetical protein